MRLQLTPFLSAIGLMIHFIAIVVLSIHIFFFSYYLGAKKILCLQVTLLQRTMHFFGTHVSQNIFLVTFLSLTSDLL